MIESTEKGEQRIAVYTMLPAVPVRETEAKAKALLEALESFEIQSDDDAETAASLLREVHDEAKKLDKLRLEAGKPAREAQRDINGFFKPALDLLGQAKRTLKGRLTAWREEQDRRRREAIAAASEGNAEALVAAPPPADVPGVTYRRVVEVEIVDASKVPREFLVIDVKKLEALAKAGSEAPPGVRFVVREVAGVGRGAG